MSDARSPEIQQSVDSSPKATANKRGFIKGLAATIGVVMGFGSRTTEAQALFPAANNPTKEPSGNPTGGLKPLRNRDIPLPSGTSQVNDNLEIIPINSDDSIKAEDKVDPEIPETFKIPIEKAAEATSNLLAKKEDIEVVFKPGKYGSVTSSTTENRKMYVNFLPGNEKNTTLQAGKMLGKYVNESFENSPSEQFSLDFSKITGIDIEKIAFGEVKPTDAPKLAEILQYLDFENYTGTKGDNIYEKPKEIKKTLFENAFSLWMLESGKLADRIEKSPSQDQKILSNIFLAGLKRILDCAGVGVRFETLGLDRKNINRILEISGNETYKNYIKEKAEYMGKKVSAIPTNIDQFMNPSTQNSNKAA